MSSIRQSLVIIIGVLVIIIGAVWFLSRGEKEEKKPEINVSSTQENKAATTDQENKIAAPEINTAKEDELPESFPDIALNGKKKLTSSYTLKYPGADQEQKVIDFTSANSVKENFAFYKDWAEKNGWNILHQLDNTEESRLIIEKDKKPLNIIIQKDAVASSKVNMSW